MTHLASEEMKINSCFRDDKLPFRVALIRADKNQPRTVNAAARGSSQILGMPQGFVEMTNISVLNVVIRNSCLFLNSNQFILSFIELVFFPVVFRVLTDVTVEPTLFRLYS